MSIPIKECNLEIDKIYKRLYAREKRNEEDLALLNALKAQKKQRIFKF